MKGIKLIACSAALFTLSANVVANMYEKCYTCNELTSPAVSKSDSIVNHKRTDRNTIKKSKKHIDMSFDEFSKKVHDDFEETRESMESRFIQYRDSVINEFVKALGEPWEDKNSNKALPKPIDYSVGPQICPDDNPTPAPDVRPVPDDNVKNEPVVDVDIEKEPIPEKDIKEEPVIENDIKADPVPEEKVNEEPEINNDVKSEPVPEEKISDKPRQQKPRIAVEIKPKKIYELPELNPDNRAIPFVPVVIPKIIPQTDDFSFDMFGTTMEVSLDDDCMFKLQTNDNNGVADAVKNISSKEKYTVLLQQCLDLRDNYKLCDWAYFKMLETMSNQFLGTNTNEARLLTGYLFCMSGYKVRYAFNSAANLILLAACDQDIVNTPYLTLSYGDDNDVYYVIAGNIENSSIQICNYAIPGEKSMSLNIYNEPLLDEDLCNRSIKLHSYPEYTFNYNINKNLMDFYATYPVALTKGDSFSQWTYYANTPMSSAACETLYPLLRNAIEGKSQRKQVDIIMDFIESYKYGYDSEIWGYDRAFFPDETIFYPESDCEDHAILLSRIVRDLVGLNTALIYYPGHLAAAVCFDDSSSIGDYITYDGRKYTVCDPTIYYSGSGRTMQGMNNAEATLIIIK